MPTKDELEERIGVLEQQLEQCERQRQMDFERGKVGSMYLEIFPSKMNVYPGKRQKWYLRLKGGNHETLNTSQGYATKWNAKRAAKKVFPNLEIKYPNE